MSDPMPDPMTHPINDPIKTRPDGSIDTQFYMARGRQARSDAARDMVRSVAPPKARRTEARSRRAPMPFWIVVIAALALVPTVM